MLKTLISDLRQRAEDRARERRIADIAKRLQFAVSHKRSFTARLLQQELRTEIAARSPAQVARMERAKGLRR